MRATQILGLHADARRYVEAFAKRGVQPCPCCGQQTSGVIIKHEYGSAAGYGMFDDGPALFEYEIQGGGTVREIVQDCPWSSGPCIFLCLETDAGVRIGEWPQSEIDAETGISEPANT